ncbi:MAG TPA: hypothetical protein VFQ88_11500 [Nevskiaceae bacterium]|nr:hypothetical protein [Nevskiaceae bacterium]
MKRLFQNTRTRGQSRRSPHDTSYGSRRADEAEREFSALVAAQAALEELVRRNRDNRPLAGL